MTRLGHLIANVRICIVRNCSKGVEHGPVDDKGDYYVSRPWLENTFPASMVAAKLNGYQIGAGYNIEDLEIIDSEAIEYQQRRKANNDNP